MIRLSFGSLWVLGWVSVILLISSISRDFRYSNKNIAEQEITLANPKVNKLEVTAVSPLEKFTRSHWLTFTPFEGLEEDTAYIKNFDVRIVKSLTDSFRVTMIKMASGRSRTIAENNATAIQFGGIQKDTVLQLDKGLAINKIDKFRNQHVVIIIYVPVGKHIKIDRSVGWFNNVHFGGPWNDDNWDYSFDDEAHDWSTNVEYEMRADGRLYNLKGFPAGRTGRARMITNNNGNESNTDSEDNYRYNNDQPMNKIDSMKVRLEKEQLKMKDSLEKAKEKIEKQLEKIDNTNEPAPLSSYNIPMYGPVINID